MTRVGRGERVDGSTLSGLPRLFASKIDSSFFHGEMARVITPQFHNFIIENALHVSYGRRIR